MKPPALFSKNNYKESKKQSVMVVDDWVCKVARSVKVEGRHKCSLPKKMSKELAEEFGIHVEDGHMGHRIYNGCNTYEYTISSGSDERKYLEKVVAPLIKKLYCIDLKVQIKQRNELRLSVKSKMLFNFKYGLGLPDGKKGNIGIPKIVLDSNFKTDFLRGLFDTDGCLQFKARKTVGPYPRIDIASKSKKMILQSNKILKNLGFSTCVGYSERKHYLTGTLCKCSRVYLYGHKNLNLWVDLIGFSNPKNIKKLKKYYSCLDKL